MSSLNKEIVLSASPELPKSANVLLVQVGALVSRACDEADYQRSLLHFKIANHNILRHYDLMNRGTIEIHDQQTIHQLNHGMPGLSKILELMSSTDECVNYLKSVAKNETPLSSIHDDDENARYLEDTRTLVNRNIRQFLEHVKDR